jgi:hypothetical protein
MLEFPRKTCCCSVQTKVRHDFGSLCVSAGESTPLQNVSAFLKCSAVKRTSRPVFFTEYCEGD